MGAVGLRGLDLTTYPWDEDRMEPDVDAACAMIREVEPTLALVGQSVFLFPTPLREMADAAHEVGAHMMYDGAHVLGLIAVDNSRPSPKVPTLSRVQATRLSGPQGGFCYRTVMMRNSSQIEQRDFPVEFGHHIICIMLLVR